MEIWKLDFSIYEILREIIVSNFERPNHSKNEVKPHGRVTKGLKIFGGAQKVS